jgi:hypothetical protein
MAALPLAAAVLLYLICRRSMRRMEAFVCASVSWGLALLFGTELLSLGHAITLAGVAIWWLAVIGVSAYVWRTGRSAPTVADHFTLPPWWALGPALGILLLIGVVAVVAPPNSTDALTYHLARVTQWMQQRSVAPYATSVTRQIFMPPWAEYVALHWQVLTGGSDRLAASVEWMGLAGCLVVGVGIARRLGAGLIAVGLTVLLIVTLPSAIIEASSTQTDLVVTFWCAVLVWCVFDGTERSPMRQGVLAGAALGLALASKGTAYVVAAPFVALLLVRRFRAAGARATLREGLVLGGVALVLMLPIYARNTRTFGHPLGPPAARESLGNAVHGPGALGSNVLRNLAIHLRTPVPGWNRRIERAVQRVHEWSGLDVQDPRTTYPDETFAVSLISTYEGRLSNPLHLALAAVAGILVVARGRTRLRAYALAILGGALLFCWAFRWQHWHARLHTPFFILAAPLIGVVLEPYLTRPRAIVAGILLSVAALPWVLANQMRPILPLPETRFTYAAPSIFAVPRTEQYFGADITMIYRRVIDELALAGCSDLGIVGDEETRAYPLTPLARSRGLDLRVHYVFVRNATAALEQRPPLCALLVAEDQPAGWRPGTPYDGLELEWTAGRFELWRPPAEGQSP